MLDTKILPNTCPIARLHWDSIFFGKKLSKLSFVLLFFGLFFFPLAVGDTDELGAIHTSYSSTIKVTLKRISFPKWHWKIYG